MRIGEQSGWIRVRPQRDCAALAVEVAPSLLRCLPEVMVRLRNLFDLDARPDVIAAALAKDDRLRPAVRRRPGLRIPGGFAEFEVAVRAIIGQQNSVRAATTIAGRLAAAFGENIATPIAVLDRLTPTAERLADVTPARLAGIGLTSRRASSIVELAKTVAGRRLSLDATAAPEETIAALSEVAGIGDWTAQYIAMRALHWPDAFPAGDLVLKRFLGNGNERRARRAPKHGVPGAPMAPCTPGS